MEDSKSPGDTAGSPPATPTGPQAGPAPTPPAGAPQIDIDDFLKLELRVAEVLEAERVEGADRLLKLRIHVGDHERQLVAGIAPWYRPEQLVGRRIIIAANLKPAKIRGTLSQGMMLAAEDADGNVAVATFAEPVAAGARVR